MVATLTPRRPWDKVNLQESSIAAENAVSRAIGRLRAMLAEIPRRSRV
ncbi:MAG: hypothetical protein H6711_15330 [Myxococcales bacterium]|nr:hypothetical protein [Myxococcales bacterium]